MKHKQQFEIRGQWNAIVMIACALMVTGVSGCQTPGSSAFSANGARGQGLRGLVHHRAQSGTVNAASAAAYGIDKLGQAPVADLNTDNSAATGITAGNTATGNTAEKTNGAFKLSENDSSVLNNDTVLKNNTGLKNNAVSNNESENSYFTARPQGSGIDTIGSAVKAATTPARTSEITYRAQSPTQDSNVRPASYQYPETQMQGGPGNFYQPSAPNGYSSPSINTGAPNEIQPLVYQNAPGGVATFPQNYADLDVYLQETQTGRFNFGGAYNSDNGIVGQITLDERNFDIARFPRSFREIVDGTAWRGAGQTFRLELSPGANVERYLVSFGEPYLFNTPISLTTSAYLFTRQYFDWNEERLGARVALGYRLTPFISLSSGVRAENVDISNVRLPGASADLDAVVGDTDLYLGHVSLIRDTRDHPFLATTGSYLSMTFSQGFGEYDFSRGDIDMRRYRLMYERPDGSGRHTLSMGTRLGFTGSQTPVFENYFAGGFSTMRGFDFRGASPLDAGVRVGGEFQWLNTVEYMFPLTSDDMIKGVMFCDFGTVEQEVKLNSENFRVAPGFGLRVHMPAAGIGAPLAFDFAFPVLTADGDDEKIFSFYLGVLK